MYLRTLLIVLVCGVLALFTIVNWQAFTMTTSLSLIFANVEAPLGLLLLGVVALLAALFLIYVVYLQSSVLLEARRHTRELHTQRELAEHAEISRLHELRSSLEAKLQELEQQSDASKSELTARVDRLETDLQQTIEQSQNSLAAALGEIDERLERAEKQTRNNNLVRLPAS